MLGKTTKRVGVLALAVMLVMTAIVGPAAAAATGLAWGTTSVSVSETGNIETGIDITADSAGVNDTLTVDIVDSSGTVVDTYTTNVSVAASTTETVLIPLDASSSGLDLAPGAYTLDATIGSQNAVADLTVNADPSVTVEQPTYEINPENDTTDVNVTLDAGDTATTDDVVVQVINSNDTVVYETTESVSLNASETVTKTYAVSSADLNASDGDSLVIDARWGGAVGTASLDVLAEDDAILAGGALDDASSTLNDPVLIGGVLALLVLLGFAAKAE